MVALHHSPEELRGAMQKVLPPFHRQSTMKNQERRSSNSSSVGTPGTSRRPSILPSLQRPRRNSYRRSDALDDLQRPAPCGCLEMLGDVPKIRGKKRERFVRDLFQEYAKEADSKGCPLMAGYSLRCFLESFTTSPESEDVQSV